MAHRKISWSPLSSPVLAISALAIALSTWSCGGGDGNGAPDAGLEPDAPTEGTLSMVWQLTDGTNSITCEEVGASSVLVQAVPSPGGSGDSNFFSCDSGNGSMKLLAGTYDIRVSLAVLLESTLQDISEVFVRREVEVRAGEEEALGQVGFTVVPQGNLAFVIEAAAGGSNCAPEAAGGLGITQMRIEVRDRDENCIPTVFAIEAGAGTSAATYASDCTGTPFDGCIETDQIVRATAVPAGLNNLVIVGLVGDAECYRRRSLHSVPGGDLTINLPTQPLAPIPDQAACTAVSP